MARSICFLLLTVLMVLSTPPAFSASPMIDASLSRAYEDNINPLLSGAPMPFSVWDRGKKTLAGAQTNEPGIAGARAAGTGAGDAYTMLSASGGVTSVVGVETDLSVKAEASRTRYARFSELDATTAGLRLGLFKQFSDLHSAELSAYGRVNWYREPALDGSTYAALLDVRQQVSSRFWVGEGFSYEKNNAKSALFAYAGRTAGIRTGYAFTGGFSAVLAYTCLFRKFESSVQVVLHSGSLSGRLDVTRQFKIEASFEHQRYETEPSGEHAENNLATLGLGFLY